MRSPFKASLVVLLALSLAAAACQSTPLEAPAAPADVDATDPGETPAPAPGEGEEEEPAADCRLRSSSSGAPTAICSAKAAACIEAAWTSVAADACIRRDPDCTTCFTEVVLGGCFVGTPGKPGPCGKKAGCVDGCVAAACGEKPTKTCRDEALASDACQGLAKGLQSCLDTAAETVSVSCRDRFRNDCLPKPSCGNAVIESGETCDGNCPASCPAPPAADLCTTNTLVGSAATCSARCEAQSICPASCPSNAAPASTVGVIASGAALPTVSQAQWPSLAELNATGCPSVTHAASQVIAWKAPAAGSYRFSATCSATWEEYAKGTGTKHVRALECVRRVALANGKQCAAGVAPFACSLDVAHSFKQSQLPDVAALAPLDLAAGDELLVAVDFGLAYIPPANTSTSYGGKVTSTSWSVSASTCVPQCAGKTCGGDGCGGSCGSCAAPSTCTAAGTCQTACVPQCAGKTCGSNGCGGSCGACAGGQACLASGQCQAACVPQCAGKDCGSDGCGGSCGWCGAAQTCNAASRCVLAGACDPVANVGCAAPNQCITLANQSNQCVLMGAGVQGSPCADSASCRGGHGCFAGTCRKICDRLTDEGCAFDESCAPVAGWSKYGTCTL